MELPSLTTPIPKETLYVYLAASQDAVSGVLLAEQKGKQTPIHYVTTVLRGSSHQSNHRPSNQADTQQARGLRKISQLNFPSTNNEAEYEALLAGLKIAQKMKVQGLKVKHSLENFNTKYSLESKSEGRCTKQVGFGRFQPPNEGDTSRSPKREVCGCSGGKHDSGRGRGQLDDSYHEMFGRRNLAGRRKGGQEPPNEDKPVCRGRRGVIQEIKLSSHVELKGKFLDDLYNNAFSGTNGKDAVEHIEYYLKIIDPIKLPNVDHDKLRIVVFLISLAGGDNEMEVSDDESFDLKEYWSDKEEETAEIFKIETNIFYYETPLCLAFKEFNYLLKVDPDLLKKDIMGFKAYEDYKDEWIYEWNENVPWVYDKPWLDNGIWKEPKPVKHTCKPFNYKIGCLERPTCMMMNQAMIVGKYRRALRFTTTIMMKGNMKMKLMKKDPELCGYRNSNDEVPFANKIYKLNNYSFTNEDEYDCVSIRRILGNGYGVSTSYTVLGPRKRNIDEYWWRIYKYGNLEVLES
ncbi:hypothetical protein Tco_0014030 [Tanacetum coccineum]